MSCTRNDKNNNAFTKIIQLSHGDKNARLSPHPVAGVNFYYAPIRYYVESILFRIV